jgi:hypothetical protein
LFRTDSLFEAMGRRPRLTTGASRLPNCLSPSEHVRLDRNDRLESITGRAVHDRRRNSRPVGFRGEVEDRFRQSRTSAKGRLRSFNLSRRTFMRRDGARRFTGSRGAVPTDHIRRRHRRPPMGLLAEVIPTEVPRQQRGERRSRWAAPTATARTARPGSRAAARRGPEAPRAGPSHPDRRRPASARSLPVLDDASGD